MSHRFEAVQGTSNYIIKIILYIAMTELTSNNLHAVGRTSCVSAYDDNGSRRNMSC